ncbi:hypothetical protein RIF29_21465 [Crotalaria pallida]|uniref:Uncharacterized protein n=1 Tax=Crotalaria pallida TaxID=3830 RepID=A0AAN9F2R7_CROPI
MIFGPSQVPPPLTKTCCCRASALGFWLCFAAARSRSGWFAAAFGASAAVIGVTLRKLVHAQLNNEVNKPNVSEPRRSASTATGATIFKICMKLPQWALQGVEILSKDIMKPTF